MQAYGPGMDKENARAAFIIRYGYEPEIVKKKNVWLAGPIREEGQGS